MSAINNLLLLVFVLTLASCTPRKSVSDAPPLDIPEKGLSYMGAIERSIGLKLSLDKSKISFIKASISVPYNYNSPLQYKWKLGPNVTLHQGLLSGSIASLQKGQTVDVIISIKNFDSDENRFVRFEVFGTDPQKRIFSDGIVSSQQENSFESIVQEVEKNNAEK